MIAQQISGELAEAIVAASPDALVAVDETGTIMGWNSAAERLLGYPAQTAVGQRLALIVPAAARPVRIDGFHRAIESGHTDTGGEPATVVATRADGSQVAVEIAIALLPGADGAPSRAVAALRAAGERRPLTSYASRAAGN